MLRKLIFAALLALIVSSAYWYFFARQADFTIGFTTDADPPVVWEALLNWRSADQKTLVLAQSKSLLKMQVGKDLLRWKIMPTASGTRVLLQVTNLKDRLRARGELLFHKSPSQKFYLDQVRSLKTSLANGYFPFELDVEGVVQSPGAGCACISLETPSKDLAFSMMANIGTLSDYFLEHNLQMAARPRIDVTHWNRAADLLKFDFCFPVAGPVPSHPVIFYKYIPSEPALQAAYYGNYLYSYQAWPLLLRYARAQGLEVSHLPQQIFFDNPEMGGTGKNWKASIYLPLKQ